MSMVDVDNRELRTTREVAREIGAIVADLESGTLSKVVVVQNGRMKAVVLSISEYDRLINTRSA